jgi:hypothetical protein
MDDKIVKKSLTAIERTYDRIIDSSSKHILPAARAKAEASYAHYQSIKRRKDIRQEDKRWGYEISPSSPLVFISSTLHDLPVSADVYCKVYWADDDVPVEQDIKIRVWTRHEDTMFRADWDADKVKEKLDKSRQLPSFRGRLISRWHFDRVSPGAGASGSEFHPTFHMQYGGVPVDQDLELSWHPKKINMPRIPCAPMDLALVCQLVAANFYWTTYSGLKNAPKWVSGVKPMEKALLLGYYSDCVTAIQSKRTLLDELSTF